MFERDSIVRIDYDAMLADPDARRRMGVPSQRNRELRHRVISSDDRMTVVHWHPADPGSTLGLETRFFVSEAPEDVPLPNGTSR